MVRNKLVSCTGIALLFLLGCSSGDLSRSKAHDLISNRSEFTQPILRLNFHGFGQEAWRKQGAAYNPKIKKYFRAAVQDGAILAEPTKRIVDQVTGIAPVPIAPALREVQFTWKYSPIPALAKRYFAVSGSGSAILRQYDDGWRVQELHLFDDTGSVQLSAAELALIREDVEIEQKRLLDARMALEHRQNEVRQMLASSQKSSKDLLNATTSNPSGPLKVTDVNISYIEYGHLNTAWYGCIARLDLDLKKPGVPPIIWVHPTNGGCKATLTFASDDEAKKVYATFKPAHAEWWQKYGKLLREAAALNVR